MQAAMMEKWQTANKLQEDVAWLIYLHGADINFFRHFTLHLVLRKPGSPSCYMPLLLYILTIAIIVLQ